MVAYITNDSTFAEFNLSDYEGFFYAGTNTDSYGATYQLGDFNGYPDPGVQIQPSIWKVNAGILWEPTLSNDTLFIISDDRLKAINAHTGNMIWQSPSTYAFSSPATYDKGRLYASAMGALLCFNGSNGQLLWTYRSSTPYINFVSTPVVSDNKVFVASRSSSGEISCVDAQSGAKIWSFDISHSTCGRPLAVNGIVIFIIAMEGRVVAFNQNTGTVVWERRDFGQVGSDRFNPVYIDGKVIVHTNGKLSALDLKTGFEKWTYDHGSSKLDCVTGRGRVYFCEDSIARYDQNVYHRNLLCLDAKDGSLIWRQDSKASGHEYNRLVFGKDKLYAIEQYEFNPDFSRRIVAFNASNGNRDLFFDARNPVLLTRYEHIFYYCVKRDGIVYYASTHGNYQ